MWFLNFALSYSLRTPPTRTRASSPRMGPAEWLEGGGTEPLPLLPFGIHELLLPGETKQLHLFEARFLTLFDRAAQGHGCLSQLLLTPAGGVASVSTLLEVEETRRQEVGVWAKVKCVARVEIQEVTEDAATEAFAVAKARLYTDDAATAPTADEVTEARALYASCHELQTKLAAARAPAPGDGELVEELVASGDDQVEWGHEQTKAEGLAFERPLDAVVDERRALLLSRGQDAPPADDLAALHALWGVEDEAAAEAQLLSFALVGTLDAAEKVHAHASSDTRERLKRATQALEDRQKRLAAEVALGSLGSL